jgi:outer membrane protein insertion porin family
MPAGPAAPAHAAAQSPTDARSLLLESVEISGNERTPDFVVLRHLDIPTDSPVDTDILERGRMRLLLTGYFKTVDFSTRPGTARGKVVLRIDVDERGNPVVETGFGYHILNGWFLTLVGVKLNNVLGADSQTRVGLRWGFRMFGADAEWRKPFTSSGRWDMGIKLGAYGTEQIFYGPGVGQDSSLAWTGYKQSIGRGGIEATVGYRINRRTHMEMGISAVTVDPNSTFKRVDDNGELDATLLPAELQDQLETRRISGGLLRVYRDTRNNENYPTGGSFARLTLNVNGTALGGDEIFTKTTLDLRKHIRLRGSAVLSSHASGGYTTSETPYYENFYLGGNYSIRGFRNWSLSPTGGDNGYWMINEELRWMLAGRPGNPRLIGLVFIDAGQGWRSGDTLSSDNIDVGAGYGLRLLLPWIGTLGMDVGIPVTTSPTTDAYQVHFLLGFSF